MLQLELYKTSETDIDNIVAIELDIENSQFISPNSKEEHLELIQNENIDHFLLKLKSGKIVGFVILVGKINKNKRIEFRRIIITQKGQGIGRIAIKKIKKYCFEQLKCQKIWLDVLESNHRARNLYSTEGFIEDEIQRDAVKIKGKYENLVIMSILNPDF